MRIATVLAAALLLCGCASSKSETKEDTPAWAAGKTVREGRIMSLSDQHLTLIDTRHPRSSDDLVLDVGPATTFVRGGQSVHRADLEEGTPVRVYFEEARDGEPVATRVEVLPAESMPPDAPPPAG